jgi:hypothetical protein
MKPTYSWLYRASDSHSGTYRVGRQTREERSYTIVRLRDKYIDSDVECGTVERLAVAIAAADWLLRHDDSIVRALLNEDSLAFATVCLAACETYGQSEREERELRRIRERSITVECAEHGFVSWTNCYPESIPGACV